MRDAGAGRAEAAHVLRGEVDAVRAPDVALEPADLFQVLDGPAAEKAVAVLLFLDGLGKMRVQAEAEPPREFRGLPS